MIRMVVFDMAGTVVNEDNVVYKTLQGALNESGFDFGLEEVLAVGAGKEKFQAVKDILALRDPHYAPDFATTIFKRFNLQLAEAYEKITVTEQEGATRLFKYLRENNILVILNTGYNRETALSLLKKLKWSIGKQIDDLITASDVSQNRPHPDMILLAMKKFGIQNAKHVMKVGDSGIDIEEGRNAGCGITVGITTGAHTWQQLEAAHPDHIIERLADIPDLINFT
jgi:phosphonatase-like hydrolase